MQRRRRLSPQALLLLDALAARPADWQYGLELAHVTGLQSGSLYPILIRLADRGLLESRWLEPSEPGRPARHAYRASAAGLKALVEAQAAERTVREALA
ncbi:PadR family transcriptional regulator [Sphingomonas piscis]|uniref:PadR family transcriptional regulator n=1 Tax=Sphingomonas piscis TaxID=2714943 RepID=A0A6G7YM05_9SPHN|nr:helix-turn-helix transcriptional regulator [Sphingomonas piscis]QIK77780.1 PadR family transcriptional regulator [Sphingomonas piscis]